MLDSKRKFGARIKEIRISRNLTQEELAELIGMQASNLSNIECGKRFVTFYTLRNIANALLVRIKELFDYDHLVDDDVLKKNIRLELDNLSSTELRFVFKTIENIKMMR